MRPHRSHTHQVGKIPYIRDLCAESLLAVTPVCGSGVGHHAQLRNINGTMAPKPRKGGGCLLTESSRASNAPEIKEHKDRERFVIVVKEEALHSHLHDNT